MKTRISLCCVALCAILTNSAVANDSLYKTLKDFYENNMPGEGFVPIPYGADSRFRPKSVWIYLDNVSAGPIKPKGTKAWVPASSGEAFYPDRYAPVYEAKIDLPVSKMTKDQTWAFGASVVAPIDGVDLAAGINLASKEGIDLRMEIGEAVIEWVYYFDFKLAEIQTKTDRGKFRKILKDSFGKDIPKQRVVTAAVKVRDSRISIQKGDTFSAGISTKLESFLAKLGISYDSASSEFSQVEIGDFRYIAYAAKYLNDQGDISTLGGAGFDKSLSSEEPLRIY